MSKKKTKAPAAPRSKSVEPWNDPRPDVRLGAAEAREAEWRERFVDVYDRFPNEDEVTEFRSRLPQDQ